MGLAAIDAVTVVTQLYEAFGFFGSDATGKRQGEGGRLLYTYGADSTTTEY